MTLAVFVHSDLSVEDRHDFIERESNLELAGGALPQPARKALVRRLRERRATGDGRSLLDARILDGSGRKRPEMRVERLNPMAAWTSPRGAHRAGREEICHRPCGR